jgi:hypothetical protein
LATGLTSAGALCVTATGQIGIPSSSKRYKKDIVPLEINTSLLYKLRPVSFTYKSDNSRAFGLIAEEVEKVIPELVFYRKAKDVIPGSNSDEMIPDGVHYENLPTLLLSELQKQHIIIEDQQKKIDSLNLVIGNQSSSIYKLQNIVNGLQTGNAGLKAEIEKQQSDIDKIKQMLEMESKK